MRRLLLICGLAVILGSVSSAVAQSPGVDDRVDSVWATGIVNNGRLLWSGGLGLKSKGVGGPFAARVHVSNEELGIAQTVVLRGIAERFASFGGPFYVGGVERGCGPFKKKVPDGELVPLTVSVEILETGSERFKGSLPDLGRRLAKTKFVGGFATDAGKDDPDDRGTTTLTFRRPPANPDRYSVLIVDDPASGRRQATFVFSGSWPGSVSLRGDWRGQQNLFVQQLGSVELLCK